MMWKNLKLNSGNSDSDSKDENEATVAPMVVSGGVSL
jgi:hypothetical protein